MSGHGQREARLRADAVAWRDRVIRDMIGAAGIAAMNQCQTSANSVAALAHRIAGLIAAGETMIRRGASFPHQPNERTKMPTTLTDEQLDALLALLGAGSPLGRLSRVEAVAVIRLIEARGYQITPPAAE